MAGKDLPGNNSEVTEAKRLYLEANKIEAQILGDNKVLYQTIYSSLLNTVLLANKALPKKNGKHIITIENFLNTENQNFIKLLKSNDNTIFAHLYHIIIITSPMILNYTSIIEKYYMGEEWNNKNRIVIHLESEINVANDLAQYVEQILDKGFEYYNETILSLEKINPMLVNNYRKTLLQCYQIFTQDLVGYLKAIGKVIEKENSILGLKYYKDTKKVETMSSYLSFLIEKFASGSKYLQALLTNNILTLLEDIEKSRFPDVAFLSYGNDEIELHDVEKIKQRNTLSYDKWALVLNSMDIEKQKVEDHLKKLALKILVAELNAKLVTQELLEEEEKETELKNIVN